MTNFLSCCVCLAAWLTGLYNAPWPVKIVEFFIPPIGIIHGILIWAGATFGG